MKLGAPVIQMLFGMTEVVNLAILHQEWHFCKVNDVTVTSGRYVVQKLGSFQQNYQTTFFQN